MEKSTKKLIGKAILFAVLGAAAACAVILLLLFRNECVYYQTHYYNGTVINDHDASNLTLEEVIPLLQKDVDTYTLTIKTNKKIDPVLFAEDIDMTYVDDGSLQRILEEQKPTGWLLAKTEELVYTIPTDSEYDKDLLESWVKDQDFMKNYTAPVDASIEPTQDGSFEIKKEVEGDQPDEKAVLEAVEKALDEKEESCDVTDKKFYLTPKVKADDKELNEKLKEMKLEKRITDMATNTVTLMLPDEKEAVLDEATIRSWIVVKGEEITLDHSKVLEWTMALSSEFAEQDGTYFVTSRGRLLSLAKGSTYGWSYDPEGTAELVESAVLSRFTDKFNAAFVRMNSEGKNTGSMYIEISIDEQTMWLYVDGQVVIETPVVTGNLSISGRATPKNGIWAIQNKVSPHHMVGLNNAYEVDVDYWLPFNDNLIGIHDLASRKEFGGEIYKTNGSHGCINTPYEAVEQMYSIVSIGTPVAVY